MQLVGHRVVVALCDFQMDMRRGRLGNLAKGHTGSVLITELSVLSWKKRGWPEAAVP